MKFRALLLALLLPPLMAHAGSVNLSVLAPATNASNDSCGFQWVDSLGGAVRVPGSTLTDLGAILVMRRRFSETAESLAMTLPALGLEDRWIDFTFSDRDGEMGSLTTLALDLTGNASCRGPSYVYTFPAKESGGLAVTYYLGTNFNTVAGSAIDSTVSHEYSLAAAWPGGPVDGFSLWWHGTIEIPADGLYTFSQFADDGRRLWLDQVARIDQWVSGRNESTWSGFLAAGRHEISLELFEGSGAATMLFYWSGPGFPKELVPATALRP